MKRCQCWKSEQWSQLWGVLGKAHLSGRKWGLSLLQHWHSSIFQQLYTHLSTPWGCSHHEIQDEGCSISNGKSYCDFNWISAAILFFFPRAPPLSISSLLPVIQQFIPHYTNPSIRQFLIPFMQWLWQQLPISLVFGALPFFIKHEFISDTLWLSGSSTFPAMRSIMSPHNVLAHSILHLSWRQHCGNLKKMRQKNGNLEPRGSETGNDTWNPNQLWHVLQNIWKIDLCYLQGTPQSCQPAVWVTHLKQAEIQLIGKKNNRKNKLPGPTCARTLSNSYHSITPWNPGWHILTQLFRLRLKTQSGDSLL